MKLRIYVTRYVPPYALIKSRGGGLFAFISGIIVLMERIFSDDRHEVLRFESGEDVTLNLVNFVLEEEIKAAWISGIGSASEVELGYYYLPDKEYQKQVFTGDIEIVNLTGNVGILNRGPATHLHGAFGLSDYRVVGGHVHRLISNTTVEMYLEKMDGVLKRRYDIGTGLNLFKS